MSPLATLLARGKKAARHAPWPRVAVDADAWTDAAGLLGRGECALLGLWGDGASVHMALLDEAANAVGVLTLACPDGGFPSVGAQHAPAIRLERTIRDLWGLTPRGAPDDRPWLDHGKWDGGAVIPYAFLPVEGEGLHEIAVGPVHAGIIEPGHFRFTVNGETVVRLEQRLGYVHKGVERLMVGKTLDEAAIVAGRLSGDSTVAWQIAFARSAEAALGVEVPGRAHFLRALMAEIERLANHFGDIGAVCNDATYPLLLAECGMLRERTLRAADAAFGHRLMRDRVIPGGVAGDLAPDGGDAIRSLVTFVRERFPRIVEIYDGAASLQDRTVTTGIVRPDLVRRFAAGGHVGRASGRAFDARKAFAFPPYDIVDFDTPLFGEGDVNARLWVRIREVEQSLALVSQILGRLPGGPFFVDLPRKRSGVEGMALVESFRGDCLAWLRIGADGRIERCHLRDPSWFQWPLLEAAIEGDIVADFPLCNKSFNCSYSGHDL
ncbi:MAG: hydrogenase expression protein HypE [Phyllobacteriaceae bacterium]|nr:hydrogenase expression protein HypE [Phyllobacteriaceae bacterium]